MNEKSGNSLLLRVIELLSPDFGIADSSGFVIYPNRGSFVSLPDVDKRNEVFVEHNGFCFWSDNSDAIWFFDKSPKTIKEKNNLKNLLALASEIYNKSVIASFEKKNEFFKQLLAGSNTISNENPDLMDYSSSLKKNTDYVVLYIAEAENNLKNNSMSENASSCIQLITGIFPEEDNCVVVRTSPESISVIIPIVNEENYDDVLFSAAELKETVASELMMNVDVSVGDIVKLENIHVGFESSVNALNIGKKFELNVKCFSSKKLGLSRLFSNLDRNVCERYLREIFGNAFMSLNEKEGSKVEIEEMEKTISTYLDYNQNVTEASKALIIHRNTLNYRIEKFNKLTGLDCSKFEDGVRIKIGFIIMKYLCNLK